MPHEPATAATGAPDARHLAPAPAGAPPATTWEPSQAPLGRTGRAALVFAIFSGLITVGYHLFSYPLYSTDEGIYMERAWSAITEGKLDPYTYIFDHAPGGWLLVGAWDFILPRQFLAFGNAVNSGRVLMLLLHAASVFFLFEIARKLSGGRLLAPLIATFFFNFSPLAIYYERMVLLDNIMVFWLLLSIWLLVRRQTPVFAGMWSGLAFGVSVLTKENAIFFAPTIFYLLYRRVKGDPNRHFTIMFWLFAAVASVSIYSLFATLTNQLLPTGLDFSLTHPAGGHASLLYEMWYQLHRNQGTLFAHGSFLHTMWLPKDRYLLLGGTAAMVICLFLGWRDRKRDPSLLIAGTLALEIAFYLARGSVLLDFYVIPLIPMYALCVALVADRALRRFPSLARVGIPALAAAVLLAPPGAYLLTHGQKGQLQANDVYYLPLTYLQNQQISWIQHNVPSDATIISDDDIWVALHDGHPSYPNDVSHWNAVGDPVVLKNEFGGGNWQDIDYIVMSNGMRQAMKGNNAGGREGWILNALDNHSAEVWHAGRGDVQLEIYKVQK